MLDRPGHRTGTGLEATPERSFLEQGAAKPSSWSRRIPGPRCRRTGDTVADDADDLPPPRRASGVRRSGRCRLRISVLTRSTHHEPAGTSRSRKFESLHAALATPKLSAV